MICKHCGTSNLVHSDLCKNCGEVLAAPPASAKTDKRGWIVLASLGGIVAGVAVTVALYLAGLLFAKVGAVDRNTAYGVSQGAAWFYVLATVLPVSLLVIVLRRPMRLRLNAILGLS